MKSEIYIEATAVPDENDKFGDDRKTKPPPQ